MPLSRANRTKRQRNVTEEPFALADSVKGRPLASVKRRAAAILFDALIVAIVGTPLLLAISFGAMYLQTPTLASTLLSVATFEQPDDAARGLAEILALAVERRPAAVPERYAELLAAGNIDAVARMLEDDPVNLTGDFGSREGSYYDPVEDRIYLRRDLLFGPLAGYVGYLAIALAYFTLTAWIGRGRTLGKRLFGMRVVRLGGEPLRLRDSFSRAGGYAASLSTACLGFVEAMWDPNRQALHDRVAGTVVVREQRTTRRLRRRAKQVDAWSDSA